MTINEWREDFKSYVNELDIPKYDYNGIMEYIDDGYALLKEQEPVAPIPPTDGSDLWKCGNCNHQLFRCTHQRYCEMCGRKVKWNN